jgi:hypothetical protein
VFFDEQSPIKNDFEMFFDRGLCVLQFKKNSFRLVLAGHYKYIAPIPPDEIDLSKLASFTELKKYYYSIKERQSDKLVSDEKFTDLHHKLIIEYINKFIKDYGYPCFK